MRSSSAVAITEATLSEENRGQVEEIGLHGLERSDCLGDGNPDDLARLERDHGAERALVDRIDGGNAEAGREDPVERSRRPTAEHVSQNGDARVVAGALLDLIGEP